MAITEATMVMGSPYLAGASRRIPLVEQGKSLEGTRLDANLARCWQVDSACSFQDPKGYRAVNVEANEAGQAAGGCA